MKLTNKKRKTKNFEQYEQQKNILKAEIAYLILCLVSVFGVIISDNNNLPAKLIVPDMILMSINLFGIGWSYLAGTFQKCTAFVRNFTKGALLLQLVIILYLNFRVGWRVSMINIIGFTAIMLGIIGITAIGIYFNNKNLHKKTNQDEGKKIADTVRNASCRLFFCPCFGDIFTPQPEKIFKKLITRKNTSKTKSKRMISRYFFPFLILFFLGNSGIFAQTRELTDGTEFFFGIPQCGIEKLEAPRGDAVQLWVTSRFSTNVTVENASVKMKITQAVKPNATSLITLPANLMDTANLRAMPLGVRVTSDAPVSLTVAISYFSTGETFRVLPVYALGTQYRTLNLYQDETAAMQPAQILICATLDSTTITYTPTADIENGPLKNVTASVLLHKGETYLIRAATKTTYTQLPVSDLTGTLISSDKPVGVISGHRKAAFPKYPYQPQTNEFAYLRNVLLEMLPPVELLGTEYFSVPLLHPKRSKGIDPNDAGDLIRFVATYDSTIIYSTAPNGGKTVICPLLNAGKYFDIVNQEAAAHYISSKPVLVGQYGKSWRASSSSTSGGSGQGMLMTLAPLGRWVTSAFFHTSDQIDNYITVVYPDADSAGLQFDGNSWRGMFGNAITKMPGTPYSYVTLALPKGDHRASGGRMMVYSYGNFDYDQQGYAYGHPAAVNFAASGKFADTLTPALNWTLNCLTGNVDGATAEDLPRDSTVRSNIAMAFMEPDPLKSYNYRLIYDTTKLTAHSSKAGWQLSVIDKTKKAKATLHFVDRAGNDTVITAEYRVHDITMSPKVLDFGKVKRGQIVSRKVQIKNNASDSPADISRFVVKLADKGFAIEGATLPLTLAPQENRTFDISFRRDSLGTFSDSAGVGDECVFRYQTLVSAQTFNPVIEAQDVDFQTIQPTAQRTINARIRNAGEIDLSITGYTAPGNAVFKQVNWPAMTEQAPKILKAGEFMDLPVTFTPDGENEWTDSIIIHSDATTLDSVIKLRGKAVITGVDDDIAPVFEVIPNPASVYVAVKHYASVDSYTTIELYAVGGRHVFTTKFQAVKGVNEHRFDISQLPVGQYVMHILSADCTEIIPLNIVR